MKLHKKRCMYRYGSFDLILFRRMCFFNTEGLLDLGTCDIHEVYHTRKKDIVMLWKVNGRNLMIGADCEV